MKITDTIARLLFGRQLEAARRQGRDDAQRAQDTWNQTVTNAAGQQDSRRKYLESELALVKGYAEDLARRVLRKGKNFNDDTIYPDDRALGFDGYGTVVTLAVAEQSLKSRRGLPRRSAWREKAGLSARAIEDMQHDAVAGDQEAVQQQSTAGLMPWSPGR